LNKYIDRFLLSVPSVNTEMLKDSIFRALCDLEVDLVVPVNSKTKPNHKFKCSTPGSQSFKINGTTFSGHPTRTTLGNTL